MTYVVLSAICSVLVSVLLKLARGTRIDVPQAVAWNYVAAAALAWWLLAPDLTALRDGQTPWFALGALAVLLPTIFVVLGASVRHAGIVRSDAAQRLSLLVSLLAAFVLFGEALDARKLAGCVLGLGALVAMVWRTGSADAGDGRARWLWPAVVLAGFGAIDVLFKHVAAAGVPLGSALLAMFVLALPVAFGVAAWRSRSHFTPRSALGGLLLGAFNFGNILFYLQAHRALPQNPALVFASMNLGVVMLGAATGVLVFREHLSRVNLGGVALALAAIGLLTAV